MRRLLEKSIEKRLDRGFPSYDPSAGRANAGAQPAWGYPQNPYASYMAGIPAFTGASYSPFFQPQIYGSQYMYPTMSPMGFTNPYAPPPTPDPWLQYLQTQMQMNAYYNAQQREWMVMLQNMYGPNGWATMQQRQMMNQIMSLYGPGGSASWAQQGMAPTMSPDQMINTMGTSLGVDPTQMLNAFGGVNPFSMGLGMDPTGGLMSMGTGVTSALSGGCSVM